MKRSLLPYLRCPFTRQPLDLVGDAGPADGEVDAGELRTADGRAYPIHRGVPILLDEAVLPTDQATTRASFSAKWEIARDYREDTRGHYEQWYLDRYGFEDLDGLSRFLTGKTRILDAGTAHGRDSEMYSRSCTPEAQVFGIDLGAGIFNAYEDLHDRPNLHLLQADLQTLPFEDGFFDFIACDQVLHHTPHTHRSLGCLLSRLRPGGHIAFYVYKVKAPAREFCDDLIRREATGMSTDDCMALSEAITKFGKAMSDLKATVTIPEDIPLLGIKAGEHDVQRLIYWHWFKCYWNDSISYDSNVITNFDWYHPLHAHRHTPEEVRGWCAEHGLTVEHFDEQESGISVLARKPGG